MTNNTINKKTAQKQLTERLNSQRIQWENDWELLQQQKDDLGYQHHKLKLFADSTFIKELASNITNDTTKSTIIDIHNWAIALANQSKLLWPEDYVVKELNKKHAVVHIDQTYILTEKESLAGKDFTLESRASFKAFYEDETVQCFNGKMREKADIWLKSPKRRKFTGITFDPTTTEHHRDYYNIWKGFAYKAKQDTATKYWAHVKNNICSNDERHYQYLRKWLAYTFQKPDVVHTALVLCGSQGVGKNSFVEPLGRLLGQHYVLLSSINELVSNFNYHLKNAVLIHANEALWGGNKKEIGAIKAMITEQTCLIEGKGKDRIMVKNFKHIILSSNEDWPVHIDADDRRFFVLRVSDQHKEDHTYFAQIQYELNNGGYEALLHDLLNEDLAGFNPRRLPHSSEAFDIKLRSANSAARYIYDALFVGNFDPENDWTTTITKSDLYALYRNWCHASGEKEIDSGQFGRTIKKIIPSVKDQRLSINGRRPHAYLMPSLAQAKKEFCAAFKVDESHAFTTEGEHHESIE